MSLKFHFLSVFRELFIPHHRSLEFRAKILAAMLCAKKMVTQNDYKEVEEIATEIYKTDHRRVAVLIQAIKEYVIKSVNSPNMLDLLLIDIDKELKTVRRYAKKIDFSHLRRLMLDSNDDDVIVQQRVYEFFLSEVKIYSK